MKGFFSSSTIEKYSGEKRTSTIAACGSCGIYKKCKNPKLTAIGKGKKKILIINDCVSAKEDYHGTYIIPNNIKKAFKDCGIDIEKDCKVIAAIQCFNGDRQGKHSWCSYAQIEACRPRIMKEVAEYKPRMIFLLSGQIFKKAEDSKFAVESYLGHRWKKELGGVHKWRNHVIPDHENNCWVVPTYSPQYIERHAIKKGMDTTEIFWRQDISQALEYLDKPLPHKFETSQIEVLTKEKEINSRLNRILQLQPYIAFDYETTGLKPHRKEQKIYTCSICDNLDSAFAFPMSDEILTNFKAILLQWRIRKIAANLKFEHIWSNVKLGTNVMGWLWDTMLTAHLIDNRKMITSLKFQSFVRFGVEDYDSHIAPFLKATDKEVDKYGANGLNQIHKIDMKDLLIYNGMDALLEYHLALDQMERMKIDPKEFRLPTSEGV